MNKSAFVITRNLSASLMLLIISFPLLLLVTGCPAPEPTTSPSAASALTIAPSPSAAPSASIPRALTATPSSNTAEDKFARTGVRDGTTERCADPPCPKPTCDDPPCPRTPPPKDFHCTGCCQLQDPPGR